MIELCEQQMKGSDRQSSKGNQYKWLADDVWYKADYTGYEGLAEYMVAKLLTHTNLKPNEYVAYETEEIRYGMQHFLGSRSDNFLPQGWKLVTLERLFQNGYGESLNRCIYTIREHKSRIQFIAEKTEKLTGLKDFGIYMSKLLAIDAFFLNEDRHTHNIAVLMDANKEFHYCPIFDNGAALLSDIRLDYPLGVDTEQLTRNVKAATFCSDFDEQLDLVEELYGQHIKFSFTMRDVKELLDNEPYYPQEMKDRVYQIIARQRRKYQYLFA